MEPLLRKEKLDFFSIRSFCSFLWLIHSLQDFILTSSSDTLDYGLFSAGVFQVSSKLWVKIPKHHFFDSGIDKMKLIHTLLKVVHTQYFWWKGISEIDAHPILSHPMFWWLIWLGKIITCYLDFLSFKRILESRYVSDK